MIHEHDHNEKSRHYHKNKHQHTHTQKVKAKEKRCYYSVLFLLRRQAAGAEDVTMSVCLSVQSTEFILQQ